MTLTQTNSSQSSTWCKSYKYYSPTLTLDEFYRIFVRKSARELRDVIEVAHEGTNDVKRARKNTLIQEYAIFQML